MAKEIKTLTVKPNEDAQTIQNLQCFGWNLLSSQEVYNKDSHLESWGKTIYNVTQTMHYVKLTFERDTATIRNYPQIRRLEDEYLAVPYPKRKIGRSRKEARSLMVFLGVPLVLFVFLISSISGQKGKGILICAIIAGAFYCLTELSVKLYDKYKKSVAQCWKKRNHIAQQAEKYL